MIIATILVATVRMMIRLGVMIRMMMMMMMMMMRRRRRRVLMMPHPSRHLVGARLAIMKVENYGGKTH